MPKVSIIIPIYNVYKYLDKCIESCCKQTYKKIEIICINDGSTDNSKEIIDKYALIDNRIISIHKWNEGVVSARKEGLKYASGEYIFFLDGDDYIPEDAIEKLIDVANRFNADIALGTINMVNTDGNVLKWIDTQKIECITGNSIFINVMQTEFKSLCAKLIRRELFNKITHTPDSLKIGEDLVVLFQIAIIANKSAYTNSISYCYVQHNESVINNSTRYKEINYELIKMIIYFNKIIESYKLDYKARSLLKRQIIFGITRYVFIQEGYGPNKKLIKEFLYKFFIKDKSVRNLMKKFSKSYTYSIYVIYYAPKLWSKLYKLILHIKS